MSAEGLRPSYAPGGNSATCHLVDGGLLLKPMVTDIDTWFAALHRFAEVSFMAGGRNQPPMPPPNLLFA